MLRKLRRIWNGATCCSSTATPLRLRRQFNLQSSWNDKEQLTVDIGFGKSTYMDLRQFDFSYLDAMLTPEQAFDREEMLSRYYSGKFRYVTRKQILAEEKRKREEEEIRSIVERVYEGAAVLFMEPEDLVMEIQSFSAEPFILDCDLRAEVEQKLRTAVRLVANKHIKTGTGYLNILVGENDMRLEVRKAPHDMDHFDIEDEESSWPSFQCSRHFTNSLTRSEQERWIKESIEFFIQLVREVSKTGKLLPPENAPGMTSCKVR